MAADSIRTWGIQCPFFRFEEKKRSITCEGIIDGSRITQSYQNGQDQHRQLEVFCCRHYGKCEIYRMLMKEKYDMD